MRNTLPLWLLVPLALSAVACGDDESVGTGGSGGGTTGASTTAATSATTTTATGSAGGTGGEAGEGGAGGDSGGFGGAQGEGGFSFGEAIDVPAAEWSWVDFPESRCINDTPTGIGVNPSPSNEEDVVIFLMGGNACFNTTSCLVTANTNGYGADEFADESALDVDLFSREAEASPIGDWNFVFVPYCTGDVHAGDRLSIEVGGQERRFRGFVNMTDYLERLVPTFPNARRVLLTGVSAGGFGAAYNYDQVKRAFGPDVDVHLLDDSGPPMSEEFVPGCLQSHFRATWGLDNTLPADCAECFAGDSFTDELMTYVTSTYDDQRFGLISSEEDSTIRAFWGYGNDDCANIDAPAPPSYSGAMYTDGLTDMRDRFGGPNYAMFTPPGTRHVWLSDQEGLDTTIGASPTLEAWIGQLISDDPAWQSWPAE